MQGRATEPRGQVVLSNVAFHFAWSLKSCLSCCGRCVGPLCGCSSRARFTSSHATEDIMLVMQHRSKSSLSSREIPCEMLADTWLSCISRFVLSEESQCPVRATREANWWNLDCCMLLVSLVMHGRTLTCWIIFVPSGNTSGDKVLATLRARLAKKLHTQLCLDYEGCFITFRQGHGKRVWKSTRSS